MRTETRTHPILGTEYEVRIEDNGHTATNASGCTCNWCQNLRVNDGRCPQCGRSMEGAGMLSWCVGCTANSLGA